MINKICTDGHFLFKRSNRKKNWHLKQGKVFKLTDSNTQYHLSKLTAITCMATLSVSAQAALLTDSTDRRIEVRYGADTSQVYVKPSDSKYGNDSGFGADRVSADTMQGLIEQKNREFMSDIQLSSGNRLSIEQNQRITTARNPQYSTTYNTQYAINSNKENSQYNGYYQNTNRLYAEGFNTPPNFNTWANSNRFRAQEIANFQSYLQSKIGAQNVPPLEQLLTTARSWNKCGYEPYQLPPQELWPNIIPTLRLYSMLKNQGILPTTTQIRSVYRSPALNDCAGGADNSKHMTAGAMDIWVPEFEGNDWQLSRLQDNLCQFWQYQGQSFGFGLGLYATGAIHIDTQGYRKWGFNNASSSSACRY